MQEVKKWLVIYIPDCRAWYKGGNASAAMGYFLDRVVDALGEDGMEEVWRRSKSFEPCR